MARQAPAWVADEDQVTEPEVAGPVQAQESQAALTQDSAEQADNQDMVKELPAVMGPGRTALRAGERVAHYQIEGRVGAGAMAAVYRARDPIAEREVALKVLLPGADATTQERFRREARLVDTLDHPHIVHTYQVGQSPDDGTNFIAMELVEGRSLAGVLEQHGRLSAHDACALLEPVARALAYAHRAGIVHRDVKPSNILLRPARKGTLGAVNVEFEDVPVTPLLTDFGIARAYDAPELTGVGRTIGTPAFMSPEQCAGSAEIDGRADIYALGAVLYRCLVGRAPFTGATTQILHAHVYDPLVIPEDVLRDLPGVVVEILRRAMAKVPDDRYANAELMADDLALAASGATAMILPRDEEPTLTMETAIAPARMPKPIAPSMTGASSTTIGAKRVEQPANLDHMVVRVPAYTSKVEQRRRVRQGWIVLGAGVVLLMSVLVVTTVTAILPALGFLAAVPAETAEPAVHRAPVEGNVDPSTGGVAPEAATPALGAGSGTSSAVDPTPTVVRTLEVSLDYAWDNAQAFYEEEDWAETLTWLVAVERIDPKFQRELVRGMLVTTYVALAADATQAGKHADAAVYLAKALELRPWDRSLAALATAAATYSTAGALEKAGAAKRLQAAYADQAAAYYEAGRACQAVAEVTAALAVAPSAELSERQAEYGGKCEQAGLAKTVAELPGRILYSAVEDGEYRIFTTAPGLDATSSLVIGTGSQPQMNRAGDMVAFHSLRSDIQGLTGYRLNTGLSPYDRTVKYTDFVEDAKDSPPSWSPQGDRLVYASMNYGDARSRIYVTTADGNRSAITLGYGKDPAWHPSEDLIVYNGTDETGNQPGLWLMRSDGSDRVRLTDNGDDQRPTWSPDGRWVVFMSSGRDDNWEVYRVDIGDHTVTRLTDHAAQDGLPVVSPDGKSVAFVSDRDGYWRLWFVPLEGGEAQPLANIAGELPKWLEHGIQWVN